MFSICFIISICIVHLDVMIIISICLIKKILYDQEKDMANIFLTKHEDFFCFWTRQNYHQKKWGTGIHKMEAETKKNNKQNH